MFEGQPQQVEILKRETIDHTTLILFKHKDKELYAVKVESFIENNPDGLHEEFWEYMLGKVVTTNEEAEALLGRRVDSERAWRSSYTT